MSNTGWSSNPFLFSLPPFASPGTTHIEFTFGDQIPPDLQQFYEVDQGFGDEVTAALIFYGPTGDYQYLAQVFIAANNTSYMVFGTIDPNQAVSPSFNSHGVYIVETWRMDLFGNFNLGDIAAGIQPNFNMGAGAGQDVTAATSWPRTSFTIDRGTDILIGKPRVLDGVSSMGRGVQAQDAITRNTSIVFSTVETTLVTLPTARMVQGRAYRFDFQVDHQNTAGVLDQLVYRVNIAGTAVHNRRIANAWVPTTFTASTGIMGGIVLKTSATSDPLIRLTGQTTSGTVTARTSAGGSFITDLTMSDVGSIGDYTEEPTI